MAFAWLEEKFILQLSPPARPHHQPLFSTSRPKPLSATWSVALAIYFIVSTRLNTLSPSVFGPSIHHQLPVSDGSCDRAPMSAPQLHRRSLGTRASGELY